MHRKEVDIVSLPTSLLPSLTEEIAVTAIREFFGDKPFVFFGTGMSCALDSRFGMPSLKDELPVNVVLEVWPETPILPKPVFS